MAQSNTIVGPHVTIHNTFVQIQINNLTVTVLKSLKMPGPISQNGNFYSNDALSPEISWFQISCKSVKPFGHKKRLCILQLPIYLIV